MNSLVSKARWLGALVTAGALLIAGAGTAAARTADGDDGPVAGVPQTVALHSTPVSVAVSPDGRKAYVSVKDKQVDGGAKLRVVDTRSGAVTADLTLSSRFDASGGPVAISPDGTRVYVLYASVQKSPPNMLGVIDTATDTVIATVPTPVQPGSAGSYQGALGSLAVTGDGSRVYVSQGGPEPPNRPVLEGARVLRFDTGQLAYTATVPVPGRYTGSVVVRSDGEDAYVSTDAGVVHLDTSAATPAVVATVAVGGSFNHLALSADESRLYGVTATGKGYAVDLAGDTVSATMDIAPGQLLRGPSVSADGTRLYVAGTDSIFSIDTSTNTVAPGEGVKGLNALSDLAIGPDGHTFYATADGGLRIIRF
ncbi:YncE family protein [Kitasatospora sp. NPDC096077]|uniref:YncE family protein n=1 Tax=Kitasatospora sp. NPDC096077 TaxID=3155544 RepID=UPI003333652D